MDAFLKNYWKSDLLFSFLVAAFLGYWSQRDADSGEILYDKITLSVATAVISFLLAFIFCRYFAARFIKLPSVVWMGIVGPVAFAFAKYVIVYSIENWRYRGEMSGTAYLFQMLPERLGAFLLLTLIFSLITLIVLVNFRFVIFIFSLFKTGEFRPR